MDGQVGEPSGITEAPGRFHRSNVWVPPPNLSFGVHCRRHGWGEAMARTDVGGPKPAAEVGRTMAAQEGGELGRQWA